MDVARYDAAASMYIENFDHRTSRAGTRLLRLAGDVHGLSVIDLACGHGVITRELARRGATVVGVDLSSKLLDAARAAETAHPLGISYVHADAVSYRSAGSVDLVTCNFGLSDIDDLDGALRTVNSSLGIGGCFVFSILHPCFPGAGGTAAAWPPRSTYYDEGWWRPDDPRSELRRRVGANHRMLSTYLNALARHHLPVEESAEPRPEEEWAARTGASSLPLYFAARCRRT